MFLQKRLDAGLIYSLKAIALRLQEAKPRLVTAFECKQWLLYTGACFEQSTSNGGLGGVLVNENTEVCAWFGLALDARTCNSLGAQPKGTELELLAAILAADLWCKDDSEALHVVFGNNDSVRFSLIRASANNVVGQSLMDLEYHLKLEAEGGLRTWYAPVPAEANISDLPSRNQLH
jgi:hypothetical protein